MKPCWTPQNFSLRPCEMGDCAKGAMWRVFLTDVGGVARGSVSCCPEHAKAAVIEGARCTDIPIHTHYTARGARSFLDVLYLDVADAEDGVDLRKWRATHGVAKFELPDGLVLDSDGTLRYAADAS